MSTSCKNFYLERKHHTWILRSSIHHHSSKYWYKFILSFVSGWVCTVRPPMCTTPLLLKNQATNVLHTVVNLQLFAWCSLYLWLGSLSLSYNEHSKLEHLFIQAIIKGLEQVDNIPTSCWLLTIEYSSPRIKVTHQKVPNLFQTTIENRRLLPIKWWLLWRSEHMELIRSTPCKYPYIKVIITTLQTIGKQALTILF